MGPELKETLEKIEKKIDKLIVVVCQNEAPVENEGRIEDENIKDETTVGDLKETGPISEPTTTVD